METRVLKVFTDKDIAKIHETVRSWKTGEGYGDVAGFCKSASLEEIEKNGFVLTPGRYVGATVDNEGLEDFSEKMNFMVATLRELTEKSSDLDLIIQKNLNRLMGQ
jgi:type I restriction enzyme M protein